MAEDNAAPTIEPAESVEAAAQPLSLLASEMFGRDFTGEVRKSEEAPSEAEDGEEGEGDEISQTGEDTNSAEGDDKPEGGENEEVTISSFQELIEHNEWDPEWANSLKVSVKVDGRPAEATLRDLVASYQMKEMASKYMEEAKAAKKAQTKELSEKSEALQGQYVTVAKLIENAEKMLNQESASIDWKALREEDPAEYSAKKADVAERRQRIEDMKREAVEAWQKQAETQRQEAQENLKQILQQESAALLEKIPEWQDAEKAKAEKAELAKTLVNDYGFSEQDVMGASDHRLILLARDAMLYRKSQTNVDAAKKRVAKVPKVMKPGAPKSQDQRTQEKLGKARQNLIKSGSVDAAFEYLKATRGGA